MTSDSSLNDLLAARAHVEAVLPRLSGANLKDAKALVTSLSKLIVKLGGAVVAKA